MQKAKSEILHSVQVGVAAPDELHANGSAKIQCCSNDDPPSRFGRKMQKEFQIRKPEYHGNKNAWNDPGKKEDAVSLPAEQAPHRHDQ